MIIVPVKHIAGLPSAQFHDLIFRAGHVTLMWQEKVQHWEASPPYYPVGSGSTLAEATDAAIARWEKKHMQAFKGTPLR